MTPMDFTAESLAKAFLKSFLSSIAIGHHTADVDSLEISFSRNAAVDFQAKPTGWRASNQAGQSPGNNARDQGLSRPW